MLPFQNIESDARLAEIFQSVKDKIITSLEANNFSKNMINHVNGFSQNNYTCGYYQENGMDNLAKKHLPDCLKLYHHNIASFNKNGAALSAFLKCLNFKFDVICLSEIRKCTVGIIDKEFPGYHIFIDNPTLSKGGIALLLRKNKFNNITELGINDNFNLKSACNCKNCHIENK